MKRLRTYHQFKQDKLIKEEFIGKLWRKITGADAKEIAELTDKIKAEYDSYDNEIGKKEFNRYIRLYVNNNDLNNKYEDILKGGDWYGDINHFVKSYVGGGIDKIKKDLKGMLNYLQDSSSDIKETVDKSLIEKKVKDLNDKIDKYNQIIEKLPNFNNDELVHDFEEILKSIPGSPYSNMNFFGKSLITTKCFIKYNNVYNRDKEFVKSDAFLRLVEKFRERNSIIKETGALDIKKEIDEEYYEYKDGEYVITELGSMANPNPNIRLYQDYQKAIEWAKEELAGKTVSEILRLIVKEKIVVIERSDSKETKQEGDKLVAGNIVYSGQNFNNLNLDKLSRFIHKQGYKESHSGKGIYTTNNIAYAFYYCYLRFGLEAQKVTETLFPTIYKITLKPDTEFFYKKDTNVSDDELKSALICKVSGFHSGNQIVNGQSVEIPIFTEDCIEKMEAIKPEELIRYLDSPELDSDNGRWIESENYRITEGNINWYKRLVSSYKK